LLKSGQSAFIKTVRTEPIIAQDSGIHGRGVFAARDISPGEVIIDWSECMENLTEQAVEGLSDEERKRVSFIDGQYVLFKPPACWVNHSCDANARGASGRDVALRAIKAGEEITVDYVFEKVPDLSFRCNCGSPGCRGFLSQNHSENTGK
jgi:SET domain-containing protein